MCGLKRFVQSTVKLPVVARGNLYTVAMFSGFNQSKLLVFFVFIQEREISLTNPVNLQLKITVVGHEKYT